MTKITEISRERIRLYSRPALWQVGLLASIFLAMLVGLCPSHELECQRTEAATAEVRVRRQLLGFTLSERSIAGVTAAEVQRSTDTQSPMSRPSSGVTLEYNDTARLVFTTSSGPIPLRKSFLAGSGVFQQAATQLNDFLTTGNSPTRRIPVPASLWLWIPTIAMGLIAINLIPGGWCTCVVDRSENVVRISWPTLLGKGRENILLSEVESFGLVNRTDPASPRSPAEQRQSLKDAACALKNFKSLQSKRFVDSIGIRLRDGREISITRQSQQAGSSCTDSIIEQLECLRRGS